VFRLDDARSDRVHGARVLLSATGDETEQDDAKAEGPADDEQGRAIADIARLQDVLRAGIRRCIEDAASARSAPRTSRFARVGLLRQRDDAAPDFRAPLREGILEMRKPSDMQALR